jgi:cell division transport system permease protein
VFLSDDITAEESAMLERRLETMPEISRFSYISKAAALEEFKDLNSESLAIYENVEKDALPASYRVQLRNPKAAEAVAGRLEGLGGVDEVNFGGDDVAKLLTVTKYIRTGVLLFVVGLAALGVGLIVRRTQLSYV